MIQKGQMSLEFLVYLAISAASLAFAVYAFGRGDSALGAQEGEAYLGDLAAEVNIGMQYQSYDIVAFVPRQICGAALTPGGMSYGNHTYYFQGNASFNVAGLCARSGAVETLHMQRLQNGTFEIG